MEIKENIDLEKEMKISINKLRNEITYKRAYKETFIHITVLEDIESMNFNKFIESPTKAKGFIHTLEKKYDLNLEYWLVSYRDFIKQRLQEIEKINNLDKQQEKKVIKNSQIDKGKVNNNIKKIFSKKNVQIIITIIAIMVLANSLLSFKSNNDKNNEKNHTSIKEGSKTLNKAEDLKQNITDTETSNKSYIEDISKDIKLTEDNKIVDKVEKTKKDIVKTKEVKVAEKKVTETVKKKVETKIVKKLNDPVITKDDMTLLNSGEVKIIPNGKLWIGFINADTFAKKGKTVGSSGERVELKDNTLILTGHGYFTIKYNDKTMKFTSKAPIRLLYKDDKITQITKAEFMELNRGKAW